MDVTNEQVKVMKQIIALTDTMVEGFAYASVQLKESKLNEAMMISEDIMRAFQSIETSLPSIIESLDEAPEVLNKQQALKDALAIWVTTYEANDIIQIHTVLKGSVLPTFDAFKITLEKVLSPYILH